ncbi:MAG: DUF3810 domain-containing protein [Tissierellales bacterium]
MRRKRKFNSIWLLLLLPFGYTLVYFSQKNPNQVEKLYSSGVYKYIGTAISVVTGIFPFSIGELLVILSLLFIIILIIWVLYKAIRGEIEYKRILVYIGRVLVVFSILYFAFNILWGLNYYRLPFSKLANIDTRPANVQELVALCDHLIYEANELRREIESNKGNKPVEYNYKYILENAYRGYEIAESTYPELGGRYGRPKGVIFSKAMSYMGITGIYFPFTGEANVNMDTPYVSLPATVTHEMAHQRGFAREDEANFIAYITCKAHPDLDFQYSGYVLALTHSMNSLYANDREQYVQLSRKYSNEVKNDFIEISRHWAKYEGSLEKASNKINNAYLKSNNQKDGVRSYGRMVDLLIAEYRMKNK